MMSVDKYSLKYYCPIAFILMKSIRIIFVNFEIKLVLSIYLHELFVY